MLKEAISPYLLRVHDVEKILACSVRDIRNQENVLGDLQTAVFNKQLVQLSIPHEDHDYVELVKPIETSTL